MYDKDQNESACARAPVRIILFLDFGQELSHWSGLESYLFIAKCKMHFAWLVRPTAECRFL